MPLEIVIPALVTAAVKLVAEAFAKKTGEDAASAGFKLLGWMRGKLTGRAKEALDDVEKNPESEDKRADLRKQLTKLLETEPQLLEGLKSLVPAEEQVTAQQSMNQIGTGNKSAQAAGNNIKIRM